jgi:uncharacterized protein YjeT (DUF2065 family)
MSEQFLLVIGILFVVCGLGALANPKFFRAMLGNFRDTPALVYIIGLANIVIGLFLVINHNVWDTVQAAIVSFFGWATLVRGIIMVLSPATFLYIFKRIWLGSHLKGESFFLLVLGIIFIYLAL